MAMDNGAAMLPIVWEVSRTSLKLQAGGAVGGSDLNKGFEGARFEQLAALEVLHDQPQLVVLAWGEVVQIFGSETGLQISLKCFVPGGDFLIKAP